MKVDPKALVKRLTPSATRSLETAVGRAATGQFYEVVPEHLLLALLEMEDGDAATLLEHCGVSRQALQLSVERALSALRTGNAGRPVFAQFLFDWITDAWLLASVEHGAPVLRSGALLLAFAQQPASYSAHSYPELAPVATDRVREEFEQILSSSAETSETFTTRSEGGAAQGAPAAAGREALSRYTIDFTGAAREGKIDPVLGRHREIRQVIDILARRRKNNPMIVGEPGVGKTALVEGLARAIALDEVPESLKGVEVLGLDLGALQAGAGVRGEFENRLKSVIREVKSSPVPIILFIDEAHTLIGAGGAQGTADAANLLKPELARGELRTIAATTWSEYKKYFEKDAALERRFQPVKLDEPSVDETAAILRGLRETYEAAHGIAIHDSAIVAAADLSHRFIAGRQLPDNAVDLLDSAAARAKIELFARPEQLEALESDVATLRRTRDALERDVEHGFAADVELLEETRSKLSAREDELASLKARWESERTAAEEVLEARTSLEEASDEGATEAARTKLAEAIERLSQLRGEGEALVHPEADAYAVSRVVESWTGIPVSKMDTDGVTSVLELDGQLKARVKGQDHALDVVAETIRMARASVNDPDAPQGVLLFVGPSGVGKTETALALADALYGGERFMTSINMSEFQEKHSVSRLIGSPPGYVGYGEGGLLTEAVRQRPYSVVLLDECEKADLEVMNLFYQVFDKGVLSDGEGRRVDFRNTVLILTSNLATDEIMALHDADEEPTAEQVSAAIRPVLSRHFKPALLARMTVVPYAPMRPDVLRDIAQLKLRKVAERLMRAHRTETEFAAPLVEELTRRCTESETGARNLDHILRGSLLPAISRTVLEAMTTGEPPRNLFVDVTPEGQWRLEAD